MGEFCEEMVFEGIMLINHYCTDLQFSLCAPGTEFSPRWPFRSLHVLDSKRLYIMNQR